MLQAKRSSLRKNEISMCSEKDIYTHSTLFLNLWKFVVLMKPGWNPEFIFQGKIFIIRQILKWNGKNMPWTIAGWETQAFALGVVKAVSLVESEGLLVSKGSISPILQLVKRSWNLKIQYTRQSEIAKQEDYMVIFLFISETRIYNNINSNDHKT